MKFLTQMRLDGVVLGEIVDISRAAALQACQIVVNDCGQDCEIWQAPIRAKTWAVYRCVAGDNAPAFIRMEIKTNAND